MIVFIFVYFKKHLNLLQLHYIYYEYLRYYTRNLDWSF